jgi:hypothetical protein
MTEQTQGIETKTIQTRRPYKAGLLIWLAITATLALVAGVGVAVWAIVDALSDTAINMIVGGAIVLGVAIVFSVIFIGYGLVQAYVTRRLYTQDNMADLKGIAMLMGIMRGTSPNINMRLPGGGYAQPMLPPGGTQPNTIIMGNALPGQGQPYAGQHRDMTEDLEVR